MNELQFDYNPLTPVPQSGGNKSPWFWIIAAGILALVIAHYYFKDKDEPDELGSKLDEAES